MNPLLKTLQPYPFEKLQQLKAGIDPTCDGPHIALSIGEPKHDAPEFVVSTLNEHLDTLTRYAATKGSDELRTAIAQWLTRRFGLNEGSLNGNDHVLPVNGTREALFAFTQAIFDNTKPGKNVLMPNPFYQIYEGAALLAGATPYFVNCTEATDFLPDFDAVPEAAWRSCQLLFLCSPGNPTGALINSEVYAKLIRLADKYDFVIASDECYSELYFDEDAPPIGLLEACADMGRHDYARCVVFHSLSKRSNLPGLRSGFVAGDKGLIQQFLLYRTYHGCAMPLHTQHASIAAWEDEDHVRQNRALYREKFNAVLAILSEHIDVKQPDAGFYLWPKTPIADTEFAQRLYAEHNVTVLPGSYLARDTGTVNPGEQRVRMALVAPLAECIDAAERIKSLLQSL